MLPLVLRTLDATGTSDPDAARMRGLRRHSLLRSMLVRASAAEAIGALTTAGIDVMVLKGAALASTVYDDAALRPMLDADLLLRPATVPAADRVVRSLGYQGRPVAESRHLVMRHGVNYTRADGAELDLHWMAHRALAPPGMSRTFPRLPWDAGLAADEWWDRARTIELMRGVPVLAPSATDLLVHVCLHGAFGGFDARIRWVADADATLRAEGAAVDWDGLVDQAARRRVSHTLGDALHYLRQQQDLPVPGEVVERLAAAPSSPRRGLAERWSTRPLPRRAAVVGDLPNTAVRYLLITRQDPLPDVVRAAPQFLAAGWGIDSTPNAMTRAVLTKVAAIGRPTAGRRRT